FCGWCSGWCGLFLYCCGTLFPDTQAARDGRRRLRADCYVRRISRIEADVIGNNRGTSHRDDIRFHDDGAARRRHGKRQGFRRRDAANLGDSVRRLHQLMFIGCRILRGVGLAMVPELLLRRVLAPGDARSVLPDPLRDLLEVMPGMSSMKAPPFSRRKWPKDWMVQQLSSVSEALLSVGQCGVHCNQRIVEGTQRIHTVAVCWNRLLRCRTSPG